MSNADETVASLQAQIDELNAKLSQQGSQSTATGAPASDVNTQPSHGPGVTRVPGDSAKIIGAGTDPRGGSVLGYSDGTVKLVNVPVGADNEPASPWGSAPEGEYVAFYVDDNGNRYTWIAADGTEVASVDNPNQARP